jgi:hypothetical protein
MNLETAKTYQKLQKHVGPFAANQLDASIGLALMGTRTSSAASLARDILTNLARSYSRKMVNQA